MTGHAQIGHRRSDGQLVCSDANHTGLVVVQTNLDESLRLAVNNLLALVTRDAGYLARWTAGSSDDVA